MLLLAGASVTPLPLMLLLLLLLVVPAALLKAARERVEDPLQQRPPHANEVPQAGLYLVDGVQL